MRRITRALKNAVLQQQMIDVDKALQILDQETPPLVVDRDKLKVCGICVPVVLCSVVSWAFCTLT